LIGRAFASSNFPRSFHSILEPHFDFIRESRQRRKTWQEIADLLFTEKGIRVTLYAPYRFYRRKLKRAAKPNWENPGNNSEAHPARPNMAASAVPTRLMCPATWAGNSGITVWKCDPAN
jgi:hypothetical protein